MVLKSCFPDLELPQVPVHLYALEKMDSFGDSVALVDPYNDQAWTFHQLREQSIEFALKLVSLGVQKRDVVGLVVDFHPKCVPLILAIGLCKSSLFACDINATVKDIAGQLNVVKPYFCLCENLRLKQQLQAELKETKCLTFDDLRNFVLQHNEQMLEDIFSTEGIDINYTPVTIALTSGTTGSPKAVARSSSNAMANLGIASTAWNLVPGECMLTVCKRMHGFAIDRIYMDILAGVKHVLATAITPESFKDFLVRYSVNGAFISDFVTTKKIADEVRLDPNTTLRFLNTVGQSIPKEILQTVKKNLKVIVCSIYGSTETGFISGTTSKQTPLNGVGMLGQNVQLKVIDVQSGQELRAGETGEIYVKSPNVFKHYWKNREATKEVLDECGWYKTGDLGYYDEQGVVFLVDRLKNIIKSVGNSVVFPTQLEAVLLSHPGVAEAVVVRTTHPVYNEAARAFVVKRDPGLTEDQLLAFYNANVAEYQQLFGGLEFIEHIPKTGLGKPLRSALV